ncbi:long-chain fatty acid--CoA ligase [Herpetosiphon sp. NSE202]|uniref:acyl-CoA synthetase n=1 Tax=Herpetosiphon sp. NSE202 TaxID=3351349 RepID=UPI0036361596
MYIGDWLGKRELLTPERIALVDDRDGERYSYRQLNSRANRLAASLRQRFGVRKGDRVAILAKNQVGYLDALFATGKLGAILVPLNWRLTEHELIYMIKDSAASVLLYDSQFGSMLPTLRSQSPLKHWIELGAEYDQLVAQASDLPISEAVDLDDPHLILYTSGTTGAPKGAVLSHRVLVWNSLNTNVGWDLHADDVSIIHTPLFHTGGLNVLTLPILHAGGTMVLMHDWQPARCLELIEREHVTIFFAVPTMFEMLLQAPNFAQTNLSSLRFCIAGGAPCPIPLIEAYQQRNIPFRQGYGLTEVSVNCFTLNPEDAIRKAGSVGKPIFHLDARIVDEAGRDMPTNSIGELILCGPTVCNGYWRNPVATAQALQKGWFYTGDLARVDAEGYFYIVDRKKDMYISGGENVYPAEIENVLYQHPAVQECAVIGIPDGRWGEVGRALVVLRPSMQLDEATLITFCRERLASYKTPKSIYFLPELPHNASGKVVKPELRKLFGY